MAISIIYHVTHTLPLALTEWLESNSSANRDFENAVIGAQTGNAGAGSNAYSDREEWADFADESAAQNCDNAMRRIICDAHCKALNQGY